MMTVAMLLRRNSVFARLGDDEIAAIDDAFRIAEYPDGHVFVKEGETGGGVYLVVQGEVQVTRRGAEMNRLPPGSLFGLASLVDDRPRSATCRAAGVCSVARLDPGAHARLFHDAAPIALAFQRAVAKQLAKDFRHLNDVLRAQLGNVGRAIINR